MKLQQLRFLVEIVSQNLIISKAAKKLHTTQSAISKQIKTLEQELGLLLFERRGKHLHSLTAAGEQVLQHARNMLDQAEAITCIAAEYRNESQGSLTLATTHTQSRYMLPSTITQFMQQYPDVSLHMHQGSPMQISQLAAEGTADFAIATEALEHFDDLVMMPCFRWNRSILVPKGHPLAEQKKLTLKQIADFPLVTYVTGFTGRSKLDSAFKAEGLEPKVVFTAVDADVIKTYVRLGLGIGIIASMAVEKDRDDDLIAIDARHLFEDSITSIGFRRQTWLRAYMYDFIAMFAPHLTRDVVDAVQTASKSGKQEEVAALVSNIPLPHY